MFGPGEYRPDPSAGSTAPADLPQPEIVSYSRNDLRQPCPHCSHSAYRDKQARQFRAPDALGPPSGPGLCKARAMALG